MENQSPDGIKDNQLLPKLPTRQAKALPSWLKFGSVREICSDAGIGQSTFYRYNKDKNFQAALEQARKEVVSGALEILKGSFSKAAQTLVSLLDNPQVWVKLRASERILETVMRLKEVEEIENRLEEVERIIVERKLYR
jgi:hypothetical protein